MEAQALETQAQSEPSASPGLPPLQGDVDDFPCYDRIALITGITGQDGSYLAELLL